MTKRIVLIFCLLASLILPAAAATKSRQRGHTAVRSRKPQTKSKSVRKSNPRRSRTTTSRKRTARARRQRLAHKGHLK